MMPQIRDPVVHFEVPADDVERARRFYASCFGWNIVAVPGIGYTLLHTAPAAPAAPTEPGTAPARAAINGGLLKRQGPVQRLLVTVQVQDLDASLARVTAEGGQVLRGKAEVPGVGYAAYIQDPEGNTFGLLQPAK